MGKQKPTRQLTKEEVEEVKRSQTYGWERNMCDRYGIRRGPLPYDRGALKRPKSRAV